jgi:nucleoside-diphosphate-sugar epimerase
VTVFNRGHVDEPLPVGVHRITGDIEDRTTYAQLGEGHFDVVCQFLGYEPSTVARDVQVFGGKCEQYVFISTASAYEKPPKKHILTEDTPLGNPFWDYSQAKADMESYLLEQHRLGRLNVTLVRPSHTVRRRFPGGIVRGDDWAWRLQNGRPVLIHGDGTALWTLTHSRDFAVPFVGLLGNSAARGEAFHITRHLVAYSWNEIFLEMATALDAKPDFVHVPTDTLVQYDPAWIGPLWGDKAHSVLFDNTKVRHVAGPFECHLGLPEIMSHAARHYRARATCYQPDGKLHALLDQIATDVRSVGRAEPGLFT